MRKDGVDSEQDEGEDDDDDDDDDDDAVTVFASVNIDAIPLARKLQYARGDYQASECWGELLPSLKGARGRVGGSDDGGGGAALAAELLRAHPNRSSAGPCAAASTARSGGQQGLRRRGAPVAPLRALQRGADA
jgi:hypothetical protein